MAANSSVVGGKVLMRKITVQVIVIQVLIAVFLCINLLLIRTFFMKDLFYTSMRYIFFANTLLADCLILILSNMLLIFTFFNVTMQMWLCVIIYIVVSVYTYVTPLTLTAMTLERYVAICMPLRHGELCSRSSSVNCILIIHGLSSVTSIVLLSIFFASATYNVYTQYRVCAKVIFILFRWQNDLSSAVGQLYFLIMAITIIFCYVKIMKVAKSASGENKKSTWKGLRTVILHTFQLMLCLIQLWCPFIEAAVLQIDFMLYVNVRYFNYITFYLASRCLSPLIYGLRDEQFFHALKYFLWSNFKTPILPLK